MTTPGTIDQDGLPVAYNPQSAVYTTLGVTGLTGAAAVSRWAGATASGAPTSGTFYAGDFVIDQSGKTWICTAGGTPGTWALSGPPSSAQLSGWLASTIDPMAVSGATGSASVPADDTFVGGLIYLPAPVSSTGMSMFCVASAGTVNHFWGALVSATATGTTVTATAATADSHSSIAATTPVHLAWASGPIAVPAGYYYLGYACDWTTDAPTFIGNPLATTYMPSVTTANVVSNLNAQAENLQWGAGGFRWVSQPSLTLTSSFPALTPADYVAATSLPFIGLY
jgi:hypothetical protein